MTKTVTVYQVHDSLDPAQSDSFFTSENAARKYIQEAYSCYELEEQAEGHWRGIDPACNYVCLSAVTVELTKAGICRALSIFPYRGELK